MASSAVLSLCAKRACYAPSVAEPARQTFSFEAYLELEEVSPVKHEFLAGQLWAMAGGTPDHAAISVNVSTLLSTTLRGRPCRVYSSDLRVRVPATGLGTYPDVTVVCGKPEFDSEDRKQRTVTNPRVIVEVLSRIDAELPLAEIYRNPFDAIA